MAYKTDKDAAGTYISACAGLVLLLASLLEPFMPSFTAAALAQLGVDKVSRGTGVLAECVQAVRLHFSWLACVLCPDGHACSRPGQGVSSSAALHRGRLPPARKQPHPFRPRPGTYPQPLALSGDVVDKAGSPASILPAGHELGTEPVPLFRKITEEEVAQHRARWVAVGPLPIDGAHARDRISFSPRTAAARATNSAL